MLLETYISDLLYRYDCVTIPELGAFLTHKTSAKIHETTHAFYPPKKVVSFNEQLKHNDGLLASYIAEVEKIPHTAANEKIARQVKSMKAYLTQGEVIRFENIGQIVLNSEGNIVFDPSQHINYLTDAFGLSHFSSLDIKREVFKEEVKTLETKVAPIAITEEKRSKTNWFKYAAVAVVLLGLGGFVGSKYYLSSVGTHNEIAHEEAKKELEAKVQEATFVITNPLPAAKLNLETQIGHYHVVGGAFRIKDNAYKKVKQLKAKGYNANLVGKNRYGLYEVVYASFNDNETATNALSKIRREENREAWLLIKDIN